jgi:hypothetical protein
VTGRGGGGCDLDLLAARHIVEQRQDLRFHVRSGHLPDHHVILLFVQLPSEQWVTF